MPRRLLVLVATLGLSSACDDKKGDGDEAAPPAEEQAVQSKAEDTKAKPERKINHLPPETVDGKMAKPEGAPEAQGAGPLDPAPGEGTKLVTIEAKSPAVKGGQLVENVGLAAVAGRFAPNLAIGCKAPCWQPAPMWPKKPTESTVEFEVFRGKTLMTKDGRSLGKYRVTSVPAPTESRRTEVVVGFGVENGAIVAHAKVRATGAELPLERVD